MDLNLMQEELLRRGKQMGFSDMEIYYQMKGQFSSRIFKGEIDDYSISEGGGLSFRGLYNGKMGYAYTEKIDDASIDMLLENAKNNALVVDSDDQDIIFEGSKAYEKVHSFSEKLEEVTAEEKIEFLKMLEEEVYRLDKRVYQVDYCIFENYRNERMIYNTKQLLLKEKQNIAVAYVSVVVKDGKDTKSSVRFETVRDFGKLNYKYLAEEVVTEAISYLGAEAVESKKYPILLKNTSAADLLRAYAGVFSAENVEKGKSLLKNKIGKIIANRNLTMIDDPFMEEGAHSRSFDSEGVACKTMKIIENGKLNTYFHNLKTAEKEGLPSTAHAYRSSYKGAHSIAPSNLYIQSGEYSYKDLVQSLDEGIIVTDLQGLHSGANVVSGDFSLAAQGYYVKGGRVIKPVTQITIAGNFYELLKEIEAVGNDLKFGLPSSCFVGSPTLKIKGLAVSGK